MRLNIVCPSCQFSLQAGNKHAPCEHGISKSYRESWDEEQDMLGIGRNQIRETSNSKNVEPLLAHFFPENFHSEVYSPALTQALMRAGVQVLRDLQGSPSVWVVAEKPVLRFAELLAAALGNRRKESERKK